MPAGSGSVDWSQFSTLHPFLGESQAQVQYLTLLLLSCQPERTQSNPSKWSSKALSPGLKEVALPIWSLPLGWKELLLSWNRQFLPKKSSINPSFFIFLPLFYFCDIAIQTGSSPVAKAVKNPPANTGDPGSIPGSGISPGEGNGSPVQYSCLGIPMDRGAWQATVHWVA